MNRDKRRTLSLAHLGFVGMILVMLLTLLSPHMVAARAAAGNDGGPREVRPFQRIFVIMMENTGFDTLIGNPNAPWINFAAQHYGLATNYFGVAHPSQPNYIATAAGTTAGVVNDNDTTINVPNLVDQLEAHQRSWKAYMQSYSLCATGLDHACGNQLYERKHNPFVSFQDVQTDPARMANIVDFSQFARDLAINRVPDFSWISPDQCSDMHGRAGAPPDPGADPCDFSHVQGLIATGDAFLQNTVQQIMHSRAWQGNAAIFITWDESDFTNSGPSGFGDTGGCCAANPGGGHVVSLVISRSDDDARTSAVAYNHYSLLATIEAAWRLGCLGFTCDTAQVQPLGDLVGGEE
jgi:phospholipase C